jgi:hypothetical protein
MVSQYKHVGACKEKEGREKRRTGTGAVKRVPGRPGNLRLFKDQSS